MRRLLLLSLVLASAPTLAQEGLGGYVGIGLSQLDYEDAVYRMDYGDTVMSPKLYAGYRFNETLAVEGVFIQSDTASSGSAGYVPFFRDPSNRPAGGDYTAQMTSEFDVFEIRVMAHTEYVYFAAGYFSSDVSGTFSGDSLLGPFGGSFSDSDNGYSIVIGAQWDVKKWGIRAEYEYFDLQSPADATLIGVSMHYGF